MRHLLPLCLALAGCIPVPYASPPAQIAVTGGGAFGGPVGGPTLNVRAGLSPLGAFEALVDRPFDVSLGYVFERVKDDLSGGHGGYLEAIGWPIRAGSGPSRFRLGPVARGVWHGDASGADFGLSLEYSRHIGDAFSSIDDADDDPVWPQRGEYEPNGRHPDPAPRDTRDDGAIIGVAFGELGIGFEVVGGWRARQDGADHWQVLAGLTVRLPPSLGLLLIPLF